MTNNRCGLCGTDRLLTFHHLIPKRCHRLNWFRKNFSKDEMLQRGVMLCKRCHAFVHSHFTEQELGRELNTVEKLRQNEIIQRHTAWSRKQRRTADIPL